MKHKILISIHLLLVLAAYTSWLWLDHRIIALVAAFHLVMLELLNGCPLSFVQFKDQKQKDMRFYEWWMSKLGIELGGTRRHKMRLFMQYILPLVIIALAITTQRLLNIAPLIRL